MAITDNSDMVMPVAPLYGNGGNNGGFGNNFGGDWAWIILLLLAFGGGWGNGFGGGYAGGNELYPWMNQAEITTGGFQNAQLGNQITSVQSELGDIQTQLCNGFAGVNATINGGFANAETAANSRQMANMQQAFANQTAMTQGFNNISSQFANCCCENRLGIADLKYTVATENCADRYEAAQNTRDIIDSQTRGTQAIIDKLCQLELDGLKQDNANLRTQLNMANLTASQTAQTAELRASQATTANQLVNELRACPIPSQPVYGNQPIFTCQPNYNTGCGCGCNS